MGYDFLLRVPREYNKRKKQFFISQIVLEKLHIHMQKALLTIATMWKISKCRSTENKYVAQPYDGILFSNKKK